MKDLREVIKDQSERSAVVEDCKVLIDAEVASKGGLGGVAVKTAYKLVKALKPNMIPAAVDGMLDDFAGALHPFCQSHQQDGKGGSLEQYLAARRGDVAEALLTVTDGRANRSTNKTLVKAYHKLRPKGKTHVEQAVPGLGRVLDKHLAS